MNRLLTLLKRETSVYHLKQIKENVYYLHAADGFFILKGYKSLPALQLQEDFSDGLQAVGFTQADKSMKQKRVLFVEPYFFRWIKYIQKGSPAFHYRHRRDRTEGLSVIKKFHGHSRQLVSTFESRLSTFDIVDKWGKRLSEFRQKSHDVSQYIPEKQVTEMIHLGRLAIEGMRKHATFFTTADKVIIHGDVADHNFIRDEQRRLFLIDYDLIHVGHVADDLLQYANRILPYLHWSSARLLTYEQISQLMSNPGFLYGLLFPTDLFREWNRFFRLHSDTNPQKTAQLIHFTMMQYDLRRQFMHDIQSMVK